MRSTHGVMTAILGLVPTDCAGIHTAPNPEARQALAPTEKLRVGLILGNALSVTRDSVSGEMNGKIGRADAFAANKPSLFEMSDQSARFPSSRWSFWHRPYGNGHLERTGPRIKPDVRVT